MTPFTDIPLTPKQQRFCDEYLIDMNATAAALRAGYSAATALSGQLTRLPKIIAHVKARMKQNSAKYLVDHQMIVAELAKIAFASLGGFFGDDGKLRPMHEISDADKAALCSVSITTDKDGGTTVKLRMNNKLAALEKLAKHTGFYQANPQLPTQEFIHLSKERLDEDDRTDDDSFDEEDRLAQENEDALIAEIDGRFTAMKAKEQELDEREAALNELKDELDEREEEQKEEEEYLEGQRQELAMMQHR